jgi:hypothetical protein
MILRHDGLNTLWESNVNWVKCNENGNRVDIDEDEMNTFDDVFMPTPFNASTFNPQYIHELLPLTYRRECSAIEKDFKTFQEYLARHIHFTYLKGKLRWPKIRKNCVENDTVRNIFPHAGDLDDEIDVNLYT